MSDRQTFKDIEFQQTVENYAGIVAVLAPALRTSIETIAQQHNNEDGVWFDELENKLINGAKGTLTENIDIETVYYFV